MENKKVGEAIDVSVGNNYVKELIILFNNLIKKMTGYLKNQKNIKKFLMN